MYCFSTVCFINLVSPDDAVPTGIDYARAAAHMSAPLAVSNLLFYFAVLVFLFATLIVANLVLFLFQIAIYIYTYIESKWREWDYRSCCREGKFEKHE